MINYIIASYAGYRRQHNVNYLKDHVKRLADLSHSIDQITIVRPQVDMSIEKNPDQVNYGDQYYDIGIKSDRIVFLNRPYSDRSFGQYLFAYKEYRNKFDYYVIVEDDYLPNINNFDSIMIGLMKDNDYLCSHYGKLSLNAEDTYATIPNGIVKSAAFEKILNNTIDYDTIFQNIPDGYEGVLFSSLFQKNGLKIGGFQDEYPAIYFHRECEWKTMEGKTESVFVPWQILHSK